MQNQVKKYERLIKKVPEDIIEKADYLISFWYNLNNNSLEIYRYRNPAVKLSNKSCLRLIQILIKLKQANNLDVINRDFILATRFLWDGCGSLSRSSQSEDRTHRNQADSGHCSPASSAFWKSLQCWNMP